MELCYLMVKPNETVLATSRIRSFYRFLDSASFFPTFPTFPSMLAVTNLQNSHFGLLCRRKHLPVQLRLLRRSNRLIFLENFIFEKKNTYFLVERVQKKKWPKAKKIWADILSNLSMGFGPN